MLPKLRYAMYLIVFWRSIRCFFPYYHLRQASSHFEYLLSIFLSNFTGVKGYSGVYILNIENLSVLKRVSAF